MASSSELSIEDWKKVLRSSGARQMHSQELKALSEAVTAADQARRDTKATHKKATQLQPHHDAAVSFSRRYKGRTGAATALQSSGHSPQRLSYHNRGSPHHTFPSRENIVAMSSGTEAQHLQQQQQQQQHQQQAFLPMASNGLLDDAAARQLPPMPPARAAASVAQQETSHVPAARRVLIDQQQKWQRISDWISRDSADATVADDSSKEASAGSSRHTSRSAAAAAGGMGSNRSGDGAAAGADSMTGGPRQLGPSDARPVASIPDVRYSLDTAMMELEMARNRSAMPQVHDHHNHTQQQQHQQPLVVQPGSQGSAPTAPAAAVVQSSHMSSSAAAADGNADAQLQQQPSARDLAKEQAASNPPSTAVDAILRQQLQQEKDHRLQEQQLLLDQQKLVAQLQQQVQELLLQQTSVASEHRKQLQRAQAAAAAEVEQAKQVLEQERQQLRSAAMDIAEFRAQQQASIVEEQQKCEALQKQVQQAEAQKQQQQHELLQLREQVATLQQQQQQQASEQSQLSAALREALDQKQTLHTQVTEQLAELQQQLEEGRTSLMQAAADRATLTAKLAAADRVKADLEGRLELAAVDVTQMREAIGHMGLRLEARDKAVAAQLQEFQQQQLAAQQQELQEARTALHAASTSASVLRDGLLAIHTALSPHSLSAALGLGQSVGSQGGQGSGFSLGPEAYEALTGQLLAAKVVTVTEAEAVAGRVRELLAQVRSRVLSSEREQAATRSEADSALEQMQRELEAAQGACQQLQRQQQAADQKLAAAGEALAAATNEIEHLTIALEAATLQQQQQQQQQLPSLASVDSSLQEQSAQLQSELVSCQAELEACRQQLQRAEQECSAAAVALDARQQELASALAQAQESQEQVQELQRQLDSSRQLAEAKDERIKELRAALGSAMDAKQVQEVSLGGELLAAKAAVATSHQQLQQEQQQQMSQLHVLQGEGAVLKQQLQNAQRESQLAAGALDQAHDLLRKLLVQVQNAAEEAVAASRQQVLGQQATHPAQLSQQLQQQLARELSRLPRMESEPVASLESAVPVMMQLPQLTISVLMAVAEQQAAEQCLLQAALQEVLTAAATSAAATRAAVAQLTASQQQPQQQPANADSPQQAKQLLQQASEALQAAVHAAVLTVAQQRQQLDDLSVKLLQAGEAGAVARSGRSAAEQQLGELREQLGRSEQEKERLQSDLRQVIDTSGQEQVDLQSQLSAARQSTVMLQQQAEQQQKGYEQAATQAAADLAAAQQISADKLAAVQALAQQLQEQLDAAGQELQHRESDLQQLRQQGQDVDNLQQQLQEARAEVGLRHQHITFLTQQQQLLAVQAGFRLRACKRASRSLKAVRARRCRVQQALLTLKVTFKQQQLQLKEQLQQLDAGAARLRKTQQEKDNLQSKLASMEAKVQELQLKLNRAEGLVPRLEERCNNLGLEKRKLQGQTALLTGQVVALEDKIKVSQTHRSTVQDQADAAKKDAQQLKDRCSRHQQTYQQLLQQLSDAEAGLRGSRETNSRLLAEGKRLQSQGQGLAGELTVARQQLQNSRGCLVQAQEQVLKLQTALLQKTALAEAAQAQLAAVALMQSMQQVVTDAATSVATPPIATAEAFDSLAAAMRSSIPAAGCCDPAASVEVLQASPTDDPKVQRIQELRAALATALAEVASTTALDKVQQIAAGSEAEQNLAGVGAVAAHNPWPAAQQLGKSFDPKLQRIQELVVALKSAAADASNSSISGPAILQQDGLSGSSLRTAAQQDAKAQRIHELRAALAEALVERDLLKQQLAAGSLARVHTGALPAGQVPPEEVDQPLTGQEAGDLRKNSAAIESCLGELESTVQAAGEQPQQLWATAAQAQQLQQGSSAVQDALASEEQQQQHLEQQQVQQNEQQQSQLQSLEQQGPPLLQHTAVEQEHDKTTQIEALQQEIQQLQQQLASSVSIARVQQLQQQVEQLQQQQMTAVQQRQLATDEDQSLVERLQQQVQHLQQQLVDAQQQLAETDQQLQLLGQMEATWLADKAALDAKVEQFQQVMLSLGQSTESSLHELQEQVVAQCSWQSTDAGVQSSEYCSAELQEAATQTDTAQQTTESQGRNRQHDMLEALRPDLHNVEMQSVPYDLRSVLAAQGDVAALRQELLEQQELAADLEVHLQQSQPQLAVSDRESRTLQQLVESRQHALHSLQQTLAADRQAAAEAAEQFSTKVQQVQQQAADRQARLHEAQQLQEDTALQLAEARGAATAAQDDAKRLKQLLLAAEAQSAQQQDFDQTQQQQRTLTHEASIESLTQQLAESYSKLLSMQHSIQQLKADEAGRAAELCSSKHQLDELQSELQSAKQAAEDMAAASSALEQQLAGVQQQLGDSNTQVQLLQQQLAQAEQAAAASQSEAGAVTAKYVDACQKLACCKAATGLMDQEMLQQQSNAVEQLGHISRLDADDDNCRLQQQHSAELAQCALLQTLPEDATLQLRAQQRQQHEAEGPAAQQNQHPQQCVDASKCDAAAEQEQMQQVAAGGNTWRDNEQGIAAQNPVKQYTSHQHLQWQMVALENLAVDTQLAQQQSQHSAATSPSPSALVGVSEHHDELARMAMELAHSKKELQEALSAVAELQQQARGLKRQLSRCAAEQRTSAAFELPASEDGSSVVAVESMSSAPATAGREAVLAAENKDLVVRLTATHRKLKLLRSRSQQRDAMQEAKMHELEGQVESLTRTSSRTVSLLSAEASASEPQSFGEPSAVVDPMGLDDGNSLTAAETASMQAEMEAYKRALHAAQEEAAAAMSSAAEARAQAEALSIAMESHARREAFRRQTSKLLLQKGSAEALTPEKSLEEVAAAAGGDGDVDFVAMASRLVAQQQQIERLQSELDAANSKRSELAKSNATLTQQLADNDRLLRALRHETSDMTQQLSLAQQLLASKDKLIDQLKALCSSADLAGLGFTHENGGMQDYSGATTPSYSAIHSSSSSPGPASPNRRGMSRQSSSKGVVPQHAVGKITSAWKESSKLKDLKIDELNFQLGQVSTQLEMARSDAQELQQQLASSRAEVSAAAAAMAAAQATAASQLQALESQLASKDTEMTAADARLQALEAELCSANSKVSAEALALANVKSQAASQLKVLESQLASKDSEITAAEVRLQALNAELHGSSSKAASLERQLELYEFEAVRLKENAAAAAGRLSVCQEELAAAKQDAFRSQQALQVAKDDISQAVTAVTSERQQLTQLQAQVGQLAGVLRQLLVSVSSNSSLNAHLLETRPGTPPIKALSELIDMVAAELTHRLREAAAAAAHVADLEDRLRSRGQDVAQLQETLKAQSDKIFHQQSSLGHSQEELRSLRGQLEKRAAQQEVIETAIARQVEEYGRLKRQLVNQEQLQAAVATKTEQLEATGARCSDLEVQLAHALEQAAANSQRLASLKVAADGAVRAQAEAAVQRQEALASLELARAELERVQQQLSVAQAAAEKKGQEIRELNHMLKAWEAMRLGKDAQIAALMERCKRNEEDAAEKSRTVDALRRKLALAGRPCSAGSSSVVMNGTSLSLSSGAAPLNGTLAHHHAAAGPLGGGLYAAMPGQGSPGAGMSNLRRSWAAESVGYGSSPAGSPTRSLCSYGPY